MEAESLLSVLEREHREIDAGIEPIVDSDGPGAEQRLTRESDSWWALGVPRNWSRIVPGAQLKRTQCTSPQIGGARSCSTLTIYAGWSRRNQPAGGD